MNENEKKKKTDWRQYIALAFFALIGFLCGLLYMIRESDAEKPFYMELLSLAILFFGIYAVISVQLILHEAGHLVFGLLSGYKFISFRIFSLMWVKSNGKLRFGLLHIAGTGGQCLMAPPDMIDGKLPIVLYNLGGSLMNIIAGTLFFGLFFVFEGVPYFSTALLFFAVVGWILAVMNGVPMRMGTVDNDGYNAFALTRNPKAMKAFWVQLKATEYAANGVRLRDMPEEWFALPSDEEMKNSMIAVMGVFACNRLMEQDQFTEADKLMAHMLEIDSGLTGLHRNLMICDRIYVELITENRRNVWMQLISQLDKKFIKAMRNSLPVLRTEYAYALLGEADRAKAGRYEAQFHDKTKRYPYRTDVESERELMEIAKQTFETDRAQRT